MVNSAWPVSPRADSVISGKIENLQLLDMDVILDLLVLFDVITSSEWAREV